MSRQRWPRHHGRPATAIELLGVVFTFLSGKGDHPKAAVHRPLGLETGLSHPYKDHWEYTDMCSLPFNLFLAFVESPFKHKCQVCTVTKGLVL